MISDVLTTGKGTNIVGVSLGVLVICGFGGLTSMAFHYLETSSEKSIEEKIIDQKKELEVLTVDIQRLERKNEAELKVQEVRKKQASQLTILENTVVQAELALASERVASENLQTEIEEIYTQWQTYRQEYRENERSLWKGKVIDLSESKGADFKESTITSITPTTIGIRNRKGVHRGVSYRVLPKEIQDHLQFSDEEAAQYQLAEAEIKAREGAALQKHQIKEAAQRKVNDRLGMLARIKRLIPQRERELQEKQRLADKWHQEAATWSARYNAAVANGKRSIRGLKDVEARTKARAAERTIIELKRKLKLLKAEEAKLIQE